MHEYLKQAREGAERKLKGIQKGEPHTKVDSSSWSPPDMLEADKQNGMRPVSKRQYKSGGKVEGAHAKKRADRKARKEGGRAMSVDGFINRDNKLANDEREGVKKIGGMKRGGKIKREHHADGDAVGDLIRQDQIEQGMKGRGLPMRVPMPPRRPKASEPAFKDPIPNSASPTYKKGGAAKHPDEKEDKALIKKMIKSSAMKRDEHCWGGETKSKKADGGKIDWLRKKHASGGEVFSGDSKSKVPGVVPGGRDAHKHGGKAKGKTHININVNAHPAGMPMAGGPMGGPPMPPMPPRPPMAPPSAPMGGAPMGGAQTDPALLAALAGGRGPQPPMGGGMPMGRKSGGRTNAKTIHVIDNAAGGGLGRLEKIKAYGEQQKHLR